jgi:hypothetical protein
MKTTVARGTTCFGALAALLLSLQAFSPVWADVDAKQPPEADKLHVVLLVHGYTDGNGNACVNDVKGVQAALETAFAKDKDRLVIHDLAGKNPKTDQLYTPAEVMQYLKDMQVGKNDNVLVFHSGHGAITDKKQPEASHVMAIDRGVLKRMQVQKLLLAKQPRALIILTDCCSSYVEPLTAHATGHGIPQEPVLNVATVRNLMLRPIGVVSITAADDGVGAIAAYYGGNPGKAGSAFTVALLRLWYGDTTYTSWGQFFPVLRTETGEASHGIHRARAFAISENGMPAAGQPAL